MKEKKILAEKIYGTDKKLVALTYRSPKKNYYSRNRTKKINKTNNCEFKKSNVFQAVI